MKINIKTLCQVALLIALTFVLERFVPAVNLPMMRISFAFIPMMICGMIFGPVWGALAFGIADILGWPIMGLAPIPLILASRVVNGLIFGLFLHRENVRFWPHAVLCAFATQIICGAGLTTLGLSLAAGSAYIPTLVPRIPQFAIFIILQIAVFPLIIKLAETLRKAGLVEQK